MLRLKGCPRCRGDLFFDSDFYGWYEQCIQCGYMQYLGLHSMAKPEPKPKPKRTVVSKAS